MEKIDLLATLIPITSNWHDDGARHGQLVYEYLYSDPNDNDLKEVAHHLANALSNGKRMLGMQAGWIRELFNLRPGGIFNLHNKTAIEKAVWDKSFSFVEILLDELTEIQSHYALGLVYETVGHRYGDLFLSGKEEMSNKMLEYYHLAVQEAAIEIKNTDFYIKQYITPYFWASEYFFSARSVDKYKTLCIKYLKLYLLHLSQASTGILHPGELLKSHQSIFKLRYLIGNDEWDNWLNDNIYNKSVRRAVAAAKRSLYGWGDHQVRGVTKFTSDPNFYPDTYADVLATSMKRGP